MDISDILTMMYISKNPCCYKKHVFLALGRKNSTYTSIKKLLERGIINVIKTEHINNTLKTQDFYALTPSGTKLLNQIMYLMKRAYAVDNNKETQYLKDKKGEPEDQPVMTTHNYIGEQAGYVLDDGDW